MLLEKRCWEGRTRRQNRKTELEGRTGRRNWKAEQEDGIGNMALF